MKTSESKRIFAALLSAALIILSGCDKTTPAGTTTATATATAAEYSETTTASETTTSPAPETTAAPETTYTGSESSDTTDETVQNDSEAGVVDAASLIPADLEVKPALWKATDPASGNAIYLMGTYHAVPDGTYPLPDYIEDIYAGCDGIAVEYDVDKLTDPEQLDMAAVQEYNTALVYTDGTLLPDHLSEEAYTAVKDFAEMALGGWNEIYDYYNIGFWISTISSYQVTGISGFDFNQGIDRYFTAKAKADGKSVIDIEVLSAQIGVVNAYTDELGNYVIIETIDALGDSNEFALILADLYTAWATGDVDKANALNEESLSVDEIPENLIDDMKQFMDKVYYSRNIGMAEKAAEYIKNGDNIFFMVGIFHFAGDKGIPALLTDMGYTVEKVY